MSIFFWHIVPLVWAKLGPAVAAVVIAIMLSAWLGLVIWVPNVVINLVRCRLLATGIGYFLVVPLLYTAYRQVSFFFLCVRAARRCFWVIVGAARLTPLSSLKFSLKADPG